MKIKPQMVETIDQVKEIHDEVKVKHEESGPSQQEKQHAYFVHFHDW